MISPSFSLKTGRPAAQGHFLPGIRSSPDPLRLLCSLPGAPGYFPFFFFFGFPRATLTCTWECHLRGCCFLFLIDSRKCGPGPLFFALFFFQFSGLIVLSTLGFPFFFETRDAPRRLSLTLPRFYYRSLYVCFFCSFGMEGQSFFGFARLSEEVLLFSPLDRESTGEFSPSFRVMK